ncbi:MAG: DUF2225 domain-containing protein [Defluviitaleaceae bacterium]|nr:DUF2225 domain-containing protein [Defluviitaleaceae bacterium]
MDINLLRSMSSNKAFKDGEILIYEGADMANEMFILLKGKLNVYKNYNMSDQIMLSALNPGAVFGEMTLFLNKERTATVVADGDVEALVINRMNAYDFFEKQPDATFLLVKTIRNRIEETAKQCENSALEFSAGTATNANAKMSELFPEGLAQYGITAANAGEMTATDFFGKEPQSTYLLIQAICIILEEAHKANEVKGADLAGFGALFPDGHKVYQTKIAPPTDGILYDRKLVCPLCEHHLTAQAPRLKELRVERSEAIGRIHYAGIDTIHFDVVVCPVCCYSALLDSFAKPIHAWHKGKREEIAVYKDSIILPEKGQIDINWTFASLYLALKCTDIFLPHPELAAAKIRIRLHWLYEDTEDEEMISASAKQAIAAYLKVFQDVDIPESAVQQLCLTLGELYFKLGDFAEAKKFLFQAKTAKLASQALIDRADNRINEIRSIEK